MDDPFIQRTDDRSPASPVVSDDPAGTGRADGLGLAARIVLFASVACLALGLLALLAAQTGVTGYLDVVSEGPGGGWLLFFLPIALGFSGVLAASFLVLMLAAGVLLVTGVVLLVVRWLRRRGEQRCA